MPVRFPKRILILGLAALFLTGGWVGVAEAEVQLHGASMLATRTTSSQSKSGQAHSAKRSKFKKAKHTHQKSHHTRSSSRSQS